MYFVRMGKSQMARRSQKRLWLCLLLLLPVVILITIVLQKYNHTQTDGLPYNVVKSSQRSPVNLCSGPKNCSEEHFAFWILSGAANVLPPKICFQGKMVLGADMKNAVSGINIVVINGQTGEVLRTGSFNMYSGDVKELIKFLKSIEMGTIVLVASFDEPATKLNNEARMLISKLGSSRIHSLAYRDNWVFVGKKGATGTSKHEKVRKNDKAVNVYDEWPELIDMEGCIPRFSVPQHTALVPQQTAPVPQQDNNKT